MCASFRTIGDQLGEAKASGNLGNTLKALGRFDEAIVCCQKHLDIARDLNDKVGNSSSLFLNVWNVERDLQVLTAKMNEDSELLNPVVTYD